MAKLPTLKLIKCYSTVYKQEIGRIDTMRIFPRKLRGGSTKEKQWFVNTVTDVEREDIKFHQ